MRRSLAAFERRLTHTVVVSLLSLVVTTLGIMLGIMPNVQQAIANASGSVGVVTFTLAGPTAFWLISFLCLVKFLPSVEERPRDRLEEIAIQETLMGFVSYDKWKAELDQCCSLVTRDQVHFVSDLFPNVFFHGWNGLCKPSRPVIRTFFIFRGSSAIKLQIIRGERRDGNQQIDLFLPSTTSTAQGKATSMFFTRRNGGLSEIVRPTEAKWQPCGGANVDGLLVAIYKDDEVSTGDYIYVNTTKYLQPASEESATLDLMVWSEKPIVDFQVWELAPSLDHTRTPVPLIFRSVAHLDQPAGDQASEVRTVYSAYCEWFRLLDQLICTKSLAAVALTAGLDEKQVFEFLEDTRDAVFGGSPTFSGIDEDSGFQGRRVFQGRSQRNVLLALFRW